MKPKAFSIWAIALSSLLLGLVKVEGQIILDLKVEITSQDSVVCYDSIPGPITSEVNGNEKPVVYAWESRLNENNPWDTIPDAHSATYQPDTLNKTTYYRLIVADTAQGQVQDTAQSNSVKIIVFEELKVGPITGPDLVCWGEPLNLQAHPSGGHGIYTFAWFKGNSWIGTGNPLHLDSLDATSDFSYVFTDDECGISARSDPYEVKVDPKIIAGNITGGNSPVCYNHSGGTLEAHPSGGSGTGTYKIKWCNDEGDSVGNGINYTVGNLLITSTFYYLVTDIHGCGPAKSSDKTIIVLENLVTGPITGGDPQVCYNEDPGTLIADPEGGAGPGNYMIKWCLENGDSVGNGLTFHVGKLTETMGYYYVLDDTQGCGPVQSQTFKCNVYPMLEAGPITGKSAVCADQVVGDLLSDAKGGSLEYIYSWFRDDVATPFSHNKDVYIEGLTQSTVFYYIAEDKNGCGTQRSPDFPIEVITNQTASVSIESDPDIICEGYTVRYSATPEPAAGISSYSWSVNGGPEVSTLNYLNAALSHNGEYVEVMVTYEGSCIENNPVTERFTPTINPLPDNAQLVLKPENNDSIPPVVLIYPVDDALKNYSYQWYLNGSVLSGETGKYYYNPLENGGIIPESTYAIEITDEIGCSRKIEYTYSPQKSSIFAPSDIFTLYPNPNHGAFMLELNKSIIPETVAVVSIKVTDLNGRPVLNKEISCNNQYIDLSELNKGIYLIEVRAGNNFRQVKKLIII